VRTISAIGGKVSRVNVIMPLLYSARQDRRTSRESLDCAVALQHLNEIGVENIMSIDVHDDRVQNAVPFMGFDSLMPTYQTIKTLCNCYSDLIFDEQHMVMVSPDFGGMNRNFAYANELGLDIGLFYKRRDLNTVKEGRNAILMHKYIGPSLKGKDILMVDDIIASGETMLDSVSLIKEMGARRIFIGASFGFFTNGIKRFNEAYKMGLFDAVFITNASYRKEEVIQAPWYKEVSIIKYISLYIYSVNTGISVSRIMDPHVKIVEFIKKYKERLGNCLSQ
jgi:ribose-phosphate pyrophosphokinase